MSHALQEQDNRVTTTLKQLIKSTMNNWWLQIPRATP